ncbi:unnamed protein product [Clavelina lepadiformis]|uniref:Transmembrane protein n=1 Tax=Clavelina lepadiformis TaxID=159417 RepID=A0ABP0F2K1_CLALP
MQGKAVLSSLTLEIFFTLNAYYFALFWLLEILLFVYKAEILPYPGTNIALDIVLIFVLAAIEVLRIFIGSKGNLTEHSLSTIISLVFLACSVVLVIYFLLWQTYVMRADVVLCGILLSLQAVEFLFSVVALCSFSRNTTL